MSESFTLNGVHFGTEYNVYLGSDNSGLPENIFVSENEHYSETVNGMHGSYYYGQVYKPRKFNIPVFAENISRDTIKKIQGALSFDMPQKLIMDDEPYKYINILIEGQIDWRYVFQKDKYNNDNYSGLFEIPVIAYDPFYYSYYTSLDFYEPYDIHSVFTNEDMGVNDIGIPSNIISDITDSTAFQIYNHGNKNSKVIIGLLGTGTDINIINNTINQSFTISSMANSDILINGLKGQITDGQIINGVTINIHGLQTAIFDGDFIELKPGYNSFSITGTGLNLTSVSFLFRHTYI